MITTREELFSRMVHQCKVNFTHPNGKVTQGIIQGIAMADGSGCSFNVTISDASFERFVYYFRTEPPTTVGPGNLSGALASIPSHPLDGKINWPDINPATAAVGDSTKE